MERIIASITLARFICNYIRADCYNFTAANTSFFDARCDIIRARSCTPIYALPKSQLAHSETHLPLSLALHQCNIIVFIRYFRWQASARSQETEHLAYMQPNCLTFLSVGSTGFSCPYNKLSVNCTSLILFCCSSCALRLFCC